MILNDFIKNTRLVLFKDFASLERATTTVPAIHH